MCFTIELRAVSSPPELHLYSEPGPPRGSWPHCYVGPNEFVRTDCGRQDAEYFSLRESKSSPGLNTAFTILVGKTLLIVSLMNPIVLSPFPHVSCAREWLSRRNSIWRFTSVCIWVYPSWVVADEVCVPWVFIVSVQRGFPLCARQVRSSFDDGIFWTIVPKPLSTNKIGFWWVSIKVYHLWAHLVWSNTLRRNL